MKINFLKIVVLFVVFSTVCFAEQASKDFSHQFLMQKVEFFYLNPTPTIAKEIIKESKDLNCLDGFLGIFTAFARYYPQEIVHWLEEAEISFEQQPHLIEALYMGGLQREAIQLALKAHLPVQKVMSFGSKPQSFLTIPIDFLGSVQYMCSHFYIFGDARYGKRIIDVLELTPKQMANLEELKELKNQAKVVLQELIFKHERIYHLCLEEVKARKGSSQVVLNQLLDEQHQAQKKTFSAQNGMLSGTILTTDDTSFEEQWEKLPAMEGPLFKLVSSIPYPDTPEKNKTIRILILFNGYELDKDLNAHLTYDMEILDPKGDKIVDFHDLPALKRKVPSRFYSQKADQPMALAIEADENDDEINPSGTFIINAILKDHIAKKDLKLTATFELLPPEKQETAASCPKKNEKTGVQNILLP